MGRKLLEKTQKKQAVTIRLHPSTIKELKKQAIDYDTNVSKIIAKVVEIHVEEINNDN